MKKQHSPLFIRMFGMFIMLFIPIYMMFASVYHTSVELIREEISQLAESEADNFLRNLEGEIQRVESLIYQTVLNDEDIQTLVSIPEMDGDFGKTVAINNVKKILSTISYSSSYIKDVRIHFPNLDRTISVIGVYDKMDKQEYKATSQYSPNGDNILQYINNHIIIGVSDLIKIDDYPRFTIVIELSAARIKEKLSELDYLGSGWTVLENAELGFHIITKGDIDGDIDNAMNTGISPVTHSTVTKDGKKYLLLHRENGFLGMSLIRYIPYEEIFGPLNVLKRWVWISIISALCIITIYGFATYHIITKPVSRLVILLRQVEQGNYQSYMDYDTKDEFKYIYQQFNAMVEQIRYLIEQVYKREIYVQKAELKQLQSQINPHFLYNSFFNISVMVENGQYGALRKFTYSLGEYFRFITKDMDRDIELREEVHHAQIYADIQSTRFSNRIQVEFTPIPEQYKTKMVPKLIIQPIVENAFIHGLEKKLEGGRLQLSYEAVENSLIIVISDNSGIITEQDIEKLYAVLYDEKSTSDLSGLVNVNRRIRLKFGNNSGLYPFRNKYGGLTINMKLDFENQSVD